MPGKRVVMSYAANNVGVVGMMTPGGRQIIPGNGEGPDRVLVALTREQLIEIANRMALSPAAPLKPGTLAASAYVEVMSAHSDFAQA